MVTSTLDFVIKSTELYIQSSPKSERKKNGQFFTGKSTAIYIASMLNVPEKESVYILEPGIGTGVLSAALIDRINTECPTVKKIYLTCYESDEKVLPILENNLRMIKENSSIPVTITLIKGNYLLDNQMENDFHDLVIGNPPYVKLPKNAPEALALKEVCHGSPNMYFLFLARSAQKLKDDGEMSFIIPRSWTSGAYFAKFRDVFLKTVMIQHIHLFDSRTKIFDGENVLQETMIINVKKTTVKPSKITMTKSEGNFDFANMSTFYADYDSVVCKKSNYVFLVSDMSEQEVLDIVNQFDSTLPKMGMKMRTGLTVDFREKALLRSVPEKSEVPLFYSQHMHNGNIIFPIGKENEYIQKSKKSLLQNNKNYLFVKRFSSKEEKRRLQSAIYLANNFSEFEYISTHNKINFIESSQELSECFVYGLFVIFNSFLYDRYYRILNGSTQVNSTEINNMPLPPKQVIMKMGRDVLEQANLSEQCCETILRRYV